MFRVMIDQYDNRGIKEHWDIVIKTEKLYEILGRFMVKYDAPVRLVSEEGITEYEYCKDFDNGFIGVSVAFAKISNDVKMTEEAKKKGKIIPMGMGPPPAPKMEQPEEPLEERIGELAASGAFKKGWA